MTSTTPTVLAVGAAGPSAGLVVPELAKRGARVRGLVRGADQGNVVRGRGAEEAVRGDLHPGLRHRHVRRAGTVAHPGQDRAHPVTGLAVRFLFANDPLLEVS